jgi:hypothetical protein
VRIKIKMLKFEFELVLYLYHWEAPRSILYTIEFIVGPAGPLRVEGGY